jgi:fructokinase
MRDDILVVGEALVDVVVRADGSTEEHPGGSPANVAVALARLGRPVRLATAVGADARGEVLTRHLATAGVRLEGDPRLLARTPTATATLGPDGSASYDFDLEWRLGPVEAGAARFVHVGSISSLLDPGAGDVHALLRRLGGDVLVSYDVNVRPAITGTGPDVVARVEELAALATVVKASDEDLASLYPSHAVDEAARHLLDLGPRAVAVTLGGRGALWVGRDAEVRVPAEPVVVVDTIGAGDTFAAGLLDALWDDPDREPRVVLGHAARAAAVTVSRAGADPPSRRELGPVGPSPNPDAGG